MPFEEKERVQWSSRELGHCHYICWKLEGYENDMISGLSSLACDLILPAMDSFELSQLVICGVDR
jgi:hypothetical protein